MGIRYRSGRAASGTRGRRYASDTGGGRAASESRGKRDASDTGGEGRACSPCAVAEQRRIVQPHRRALRGEIVHSEGVGQGGPGGCSRVVERECRGGVGGGAAGEGVGEGGKGGQ
eukprot:scaffold4045_cov73-Isochrysis_galbana.AAC.1